MKRFRFNILFLSLLVIASCGDNLGKNERKALEMSEVKCIEQGSNHLVFAWEAVKAASHYEITIDGGKTVSSYDTEYRLNGLAPESEHSLAVRAISSSIEWYDSEERGCTARTLPYTDGGDGGDGGPRRCHDCGRGAAYWYNDPDERRIEKERDRDHAAGWRVELDDSSAVHS